MTNQTTYFRLGDANDEGDNCIDGQVVIENSNGIAIHFDGHSQATGHYAPIVYVELYDNSVIVRLYADVNSEEPTHTVNMDGARDEEMTRV